MEISGDCEWTDSMMPQVSASKPYFARVYPISVIVLRTRSWMLTLPFEVISPATTIETGRQERLAGHAAHGVLREERVEDRVRYLVGYFIRMTLGYRFRGKEVILVNTAHLISSWPVRP